MKSFKSFLVEKPVKNPFKEPDPWWLDADPEVDDLVGDIEKDQKRKDWKSQKGKNKILDTVDPRGADKKARRFKQSFGEPTGADPKTGEGTYKRRSFTPNSDVKRVSGTSSRATSVNISSTDSKIVTVWTMPEKYILNQLKE